MKIFLKKVLMICLSILITLSLLDIFYTWALTQKPLYNIRENAHFDYLIMGDSRSNPLVAFYLGHISGAKVMNIADPGQILEDNSAILDYFFRRGNTTDRVLIQIDWKIGSKTESEKEWVYAPYLIKERGLLSPRIPFKLYAENNRNFKPMQLVKNLSDKMQGNPEIPLSDTNRILATNIPFRYNEKLKVDYSVAPFRMDYINALVRSLKEKGVKEVIFFSMPYLPEWINTQSDPSSFKGKIQQTGHTYHDFSTVYPDTTWFKDYLHVRNSRYLDFCRKFSSVVMTGHRKDLQHKAAILTRSAMP